MKVVIFSLLMFFSCSTLCQGINNFNQKYFEPIDSKHLESFFEIVNVKGELLIEELPVESIGFTLSDVLFHKSDDSLRVIDFYLEKIVIEEKSKRRTINPCDSISLSEILCKKLRIFFFENTTHTDLKLENGLYISHLNLKYRGTKK